jgi:hypothetical protein
LTVLQKSIENSQACFLAGCVDLPSLAPRFETDCKLAACHVEVDAVKKNESSAKCRQQKLEIEKELVSVAKKLRALRSGNG